MTKSQDLLRRSGDLKRELVLFAQTGRFEAALRQALKERAGASATGDTTADINFLDHFILQHRLPDGSTVTEQFVHAHPELSEADRALLLSWRDVVEGIFRVEGMLDDAIQLVNLVDELTYPVYSNMGQDVLAATQAGSFLLGRLVPLEDAWLVSGAMSMMQESEAAEAYRIAGRLAGQHPSLEFRNPRKLEQAWELQREEREAFIAFFGSDLVVLPGREVADRMRAYDHFRMYEYRDAKGQTAAERAKALYGVEPRVPDYQLPEDFHDMETIGLIFDEVDGLNFLMNLGTVLEAFGRPERSVQRRYRKTVLRYLKEPSTSPRLLRRLAAQDPHRASMVFQKVLKQPHFSWERDGEALLRQYKAGYFARPVLPSVVPVSGTVARAQMQAATMGDAPGDAP
jgi:hypothetical protein